jgi:hypothetical protein
MIRRTLRTAALLGVVLGSVLATLVQPATAQIMGDLPTITLHWGGSALQSYDVSGLTATKGVVQAQASDRFGLEVTALFRDGDGVFHTTVLSKLPLIEDKDLSLKQGSKVTLTGVGQTLSDDLRKLLAEPRPDPITLEATVSLVIETGSGVTQVLDTIRATTIVGPQDS